jgi:hypothetical protein
MAFYKVVHEIEVDADSPLEAAKTIQEWMDEADHKWQFYVQEEKSAELFSVDLEKEDKDAVLPVEEYYPIIPALFKHKK